MSGIGDSVQLHNGSGEEHFDFDPKNKAFAAVQVVKCPWADRATTISGLKFTGYPGISGIYATNFDVKPVGKSTGSNSWESAAITVGYKNLPFDPTVKKEISVETDSVNYSLDKDGHEFESGGTPQDKKVNLEPQVMVTFVHYKVTLHDQTTIAEATWSGCIDKVNNGAWAASTDTGYQSWAAGHVLYEGYCFTEKIMSDGTLSYEITHNFLASSIDHRKEWNPQLGDWDKVKSKVTGTFKYEETDLSAIGI